MTATPRTLRSPLTPFVASALLTVALLVTCGLVFASRYRDILEIETTATRLTRLEGRIMRLDEILTMSARMAAVTGEPQWEQRYHDYDEQLDVAVADVAAIAPDEFRDLAERTQTTDLALDAKEIQALALSRQGKRAEAAAVFDAAYEQLKQSRERNMTDLLTAISSAVADRLDAHRSSVIATVIASAIALVFLVVLWLHMLRLIRRYIRDRSDAEAALRKAHATLEARVEDRTREVAAGREQYRSLVENIDAISFEWDPVTRRMLYIAPQAARLFGHPIEALHGADFFAHVLAGDVRAGLADDIAAFLAGDGGTLDCRMVTAAQRPIYIRLLLGARGQTQTARGVMLDITQQRQLESELQQAQKLESLGKLAAGVAHEINTPIQFVRDSVQFVRDSVAELMAVLDHHRRATASTAAGEPSPELARAAQAAEADADMAYLAEQVPDALDRALEGLVRITTIVRAMKVYSHPRRDRCAVDLNESIASTLAIARGEYKYVADLETEFGQLPPVTCFASELNQVILNLVINAAHAISDVVAGTPQRGRITVTTRRDGDDVVIAVADTGTGIPEDVRARVFEPFFTTKDIGKGTGQGLSHARTVVVDKHHGSLSFDTELGAGTTFYVRIPIGSADQLAA